MSEVAVLTVEKYIPVRKQQTGEPSKRNDCKENCLKCKKEKVY